MRSVTFTAIEGIPLVNQGDNLGGLICSAMAASGLKAARGDILVVCQKVISKAEGRTCENPPRWPLHMRRAGRRIRARSNWC